MREEGDVLAELPEQQRLVDAHGSRAEHADAAQVAAQREHARQAQADREHHVHQHADHQLAVAALARADVGIAMGGGTDVALETADAALLQGKVTGVTELVQLSRATMNNIRQNIFFALGLKALFLVTTLLGYTNLWMAILADTGATAIVTANALRLLRWKGHAH